MTVNFDSSTIYVGYTICEMMLRAKNRKSGQSGYGTFILTFRDLFCVAGTGQKGSATGSASGAGEGGGAPGSGSDSQASVEAGVGGGGRLLAR